MKVDTMLKKEDLILFIGLGGAGQRHLRILREILPNNNFIGFRKKFKTPLLKPDFTVDKKNNISSKYSIKIYDDLEKIKKYNPKLTIISTPTSKLIDYSLLAKSLGSHVFVEKPGITNLNDYKIIEKNFINSELTYQIGFQRTYHPLFIKLRELIKDLNFGKLLSIKVKVSSLVTEWHPYEDYKDLYACRKDLGGGVLLTECHEIDMICKLLGRPSNIRSKFIYNQNLNLDVEDNAKIYAEFNSIKVNFDLSFYRKPSSRLFQFEFDFASIILDLINNKLYVKTNKKEICHQSNNDPDSFFRNQALNIIKLQNKNKYVLQNLKNITLIIDKNNHTSHKKEKIT